MGAVERVGVHHALGRDVPFVGLVRRLVGLDHGPVVAGQHVDVGGHVPQVAGVGDQVAEQVAGLGSGLRRRGHLHQVEVHVQHARVPPGRGRGQRALEHLARLDGVGTLGRLPGREVPHLPRRDVHQGLGEQRCDVEVVGERLVRRAHRRRVPLAPAGVALGGLDHRIAGRQRRDQRLLDLRGPGGEPLGVLARLPSGGEGRAQAGRIEVVPGVVVVGADDVGDAPVRHRAVGVGLERAFEATPGLLVVEAIGPGQAAVEPGLRLRRRRRDRAVVGAQVEVLTRARIVVTVGHGGAPSRWQLLVSTSLPAPAPARSPPPSRDRERAGGAQLPV